MQQKNQEQIHSPEDLNQYVQVITPGYWMILGAVVILLAGMVLWGIFGHMESKLATRVYVADGAARCFVAEADISEVPAGTEVEVNGTRTKITNIAADPIRAGSIMSEYQLEQLDAPNVTADSWYYRADLDITSLHDGWYKGSIIIESISPMQFLLN